MIKYLYFILDFIIRYRIKIFLHICIFGKMDKKCALCALCENIKIFFNELILLMRRGSSTEN